LICDPTLRLHLELPLGWGEQLGARWGQALQPASPLVALLGSAGRRALLERQGSATEPGSQGSIRKKTPRI